MGLGLELGFTLGLGLLLGSGLGLVSSLKVSSPGPSSGIIIDSFGQLRDEQTEARIRARVGARARAGVIDRFTEIWARARVRRGGAHTGARATYWRAYPCDRSYCITITPTT